jgi:flagellar hook-associated protein 2
MPSFGFGTITSQGVGSNINIAGIVGELMEIERIPLNRLEAQKTQFDARISSLGKIKSSLSAFQSALSSLTTSAGLQPTSASSSNTAFVTASGTNSAVTGNYSVEITNLASRQKLVAAGQADATAAIGTGTSTTLTIDLGTISGGTLTAGKYTGASFNSGSSFDVTIDSNNNTLEGIRDAINDANQGVTATIVNDGDASNPYRLVLSSSESGVDQSIKISVAGEADIATLLAHDPANDTGQNLTENVTAADAAFTVDGIAITKSSNTVTDVIQGVTLDLVAETTGPVTISVSQDTDSTTSIIENFISAYNDLRELINEETASGIGDTEEGVFAGDSATRSIYNTLRDEMIQAPTGLTSTTYTNLSSIGISFQTDGSLALDSAKLSTAIQDDSDSVSELFSSADGYATRLDSILSDMVDYGGTIDTRTDGYKDRVDSLEDRIVNMEDRLARTESRIRARFTALDVLVNSMSTTSSYLSQQLEMLNAQTGG